jgi:prepilin-type N-terminal cleavage/methylation domain-containing protein
MKTQQKEKGFTIIEVVLVLAIAGLIFLMVFIALPSLQRSQRDTQRKNDVSRMLTQLTSYSSNNQGSIPTAASFNVVGGFIEKYLGGTNNTTGSGYQDPSTGAGYVDNGKDLSTNTGKIGDIYYKDMAICGSDGTLILQAPTNSVTARNYAIQIVLENQSLTTPYCVDNHS